LSDSGKLFANVYLYSFLHAALWFNQEISSFKKLTHSPLLLQHDDADILRTHGLQWQQPRNWFFVIILEACKILSQL